MSLEQKFSDEDIQNIQTFAIKVLQRWGSWASRNGAVQMFCLATKRNMYLGKFANSERFLAVLPEHIKFSVNWIEIRSMSKVFWGKLYCKMSDPFCQCFLVWRLLEDLKIRKNSDEVHWNGWTNRKMFYAWNYIFKKYISNMIFWC